jgi:hypothetical protein
MTFCSELVRYLDLREIFGGLYFYNAYTLILYCLWEITTVILNKTKNTLQNTENRK